MMKKLVLIFVVLTVLAGCSISTQTSSTQDDSKAGQLVTATPELDAPEQINPGQQIETELYEAFAIINDDFIYSLKPEELFDGDEVENFLLALTNGEAQFTANGINYLYQRMREDSYRIFRLVPVVEVLMDIVSPVQGQLVSEELIAAYRSAAEAEQDNFEHQGIFYAISKTGRVTKISTLTDAALASKAHIEPYNQQSLEVTSLYEFRVGLESSLADEAASFVFSDEKYTLFEVPGGYTILDPLGNLFAEISNIYVIPRNSDTELPLEFKNMVREALESGEDSFGFGQIDGVEIEYLITEASNGYSIKPLMEMP